MIDLGDLKPDWQSKCGVFIYALVDPRTDEVRYVGKTSRPISWRVSGHVSEAKRGSHRYVCRWLKTLLDEGMTPTPILLVQATRKTWKQWERRFIKWFRGMGCPLTNLSDGGEGASGYKYTKEQRERRAAQLRTGSFHKCDNCGEDTWVRRSESAKRPHHFCSRRCYHKWQKGRTKPVPHRDLAAKASVEKRRSQTRCKRHHPLSGENLFITSSGGRGCRECRKIHKRNYRARRAAA